MKTGTINVLPLTVFSPAHPLLWMGSLSGFFEKHPFLKVPHRFSFYMLIYIEHAKGCVFIDNEMFHADQPSVICVKPNSVCSINIDNAAAGHIICFTEDFFSLRYNTNMLYQFSFLKMELPGVFQIAPMALQKWKTLALLMQNEFESPEKNKDKILRSFLNILLCDLDRYFSPALSDDSNGIREEKIRTFETLLEQNYSQYKTASFYARQMHITTNYLNKLCHQFKGASSGELIRKRVTLEAKRLLHHTTLSVNEIASELGFESDSYFITFFKRNAGVSPERFRKNYQ